MRGLPGLQRCAAVCQRCIPCLQGCLPACVSLLSIQQHRLCIRRDTPHMTRRAAASQEVYLKVPDTSGEAMRRSSQASPAVVLH